MSINGTNQQKSRKEGRRHIAKDDDDEEKLFHIKFHQNGDYLYSVLGKCLWNFIMIFRPHDLETEVEKNTKYLRVQLFSTTFLVFLRLGFFERNVARKVEKFFKIFREF